MAPDSTPLLRTKLHVPAPRADRVHRKRLFERLDAGRRTALSLVSAPAGFGKSTLISDWLQNRERSAAWLSLDATDSDLRRFLSYLVAALERPLPGVGRGLLPALAAPRLPEDPEPLLTPLLNELCECSGCILVLDDYHVIQAGEVHGALGWLLERLPPEVHLVMTTRVDPPLPLPRLRARGLLCELRAEDLRFTGEEAAAFLRETMGLDVTATEVEALERRTEGWIAGLQMAALSLRGRDDVSAFIAGFTGSHRFVLDYLTEEVLDRQPPDRMDFLLRTSLLTRLSGPLCDAVAGREDGQEILESLETANLFLIPLDDRRGWYRYHHLFASLLQDELRRRVDDAELTGLHQRASDWFAAHALPDEAMNHAAAARDWERAAQIMLAHADGALHRGEINTVYRWFTEMPDEVYRRHPHLLLGKALTLFASFHFPEFGATLAEIERAAESSDDPVLLAGRDAMRALALSGRAEHAAVVTYATRALESLPPDPTMRGLVTVVLGISLARVLGQSARALEVLDEAAALNAAAGNLTLFVVARGHQGWVELLRGNLDRSLERYRQALAHFPPGAGASGLPLPGTSLAYDGFACVHLERGELDDALEQANLAARLSRGGDVAGNHVKNVATLAVIHTARGEIAAAREVAAELERLMERTQMPVYQMVTESVGLRVDVVQGKREGRADLLERVRRWGVEWGLFEGWDRLRERLMPELPRDYAHLTIAHLLVATGRFTEALDLLAALWEIAVEEEWCHSQIEIAILQTLTRQGQGERGEATADAFFEPLARALALAEPQGFLQMFVNEREPMTRLLAAYDRARPGALATPLGRRLREALDLEREAAPATIAPPRPIPSSAFEALSDRELEVLRAVAVGLSNAEAAKRLYLSPFTVKKHLENIYGKLGVRNRTEAIGKAQSLGWLERAGA
jgi:LuxR family maltose regulon positive regulatory protein